MSTRRHDTRRNPEELSDDEESSLALKKAGVGCLVVIGIVFLIALSPLFLDSGSEESDAIVGNLSAERLVAPGMREREVLELMEKPTPPWTVLYLNEWDGGEGWRVGVPATGGAQLQLSSRGGAVDESPYYAYIFFSATDRDSDPTFAYFERVTERVFHVGRVSCTDTLAALATGGHQTGVPDGSACRP